MRGNINLLQQQTVTNEMERTIKVTDMSHDQNKSLK